MYSVVSLFLINHHCGLGAWEILTDRYRADAHGQMGICTLGRSFCKPVPRGSSPCSVCRSYPETSILGRHKSHKVRCDGSSLSPVLRNSALSLQQGPWY